jgi:hypothetical protein
VNLPLPLEQSLRAACPVRCVSPGVASARADSCASGNAGIARSLLEEEDTSSPNSFVARQIRGTIENKVPRKGRKARVGIQFDELTVNERVYLDSLATVRARW